MRMVPINTETPKGLLEVNSEPLIERIIRQLHEVNIKEIYVVVGYMKEKYEYLIDEFGVELLVNDTVYVVDSPSESNVYLYVHSGLSIGFNSQHSPLASWNPIHLYPTKLTSYP